MIEQASIRKLIPHAGSMCLIESVTDWDAGRIECRTATHRAHTNPLRHCDRLHAVHLLEYAAQAAAIHGALLANLPDQRVAPGMLASVRNLELCRDWIHDLPGFLTIVAYRQLANADGLIYTFDAAADDFTPLAHGRLAVIIGV